jgi:GNAT superfamily N-acetyltransferase
MGPLPSDCMTDAPPVLRSPTSSDYDVLIGQINEWWGGREVRHLLPRLFFQHFAPLSFVMDGKGDAGPIAFLIGFASQTDPALGYIHFVGVHPDHRREGLARLMYGAFFDRARERGIHRVMAITSPVNRTSIAFHRSMGFVPHPGAGEAEGIPFQPNYDGPGDDRVVFERPI